MLPTVSAYLESPVPCWLRHNAISLRVRRGRRGLLRDRALRQHQSRLAKDRTCVVVFLLRSLARVAGIVVFLQLVDGGGLLGHVRDHERHRD